MNTRANWAAILGAALAVAVGIIPAPAGLPGAINYQARLLDGTNLYNGPATVVFRVFDDPLAGIEWYRDSNVVTVVDGLYTAVLGDGSGFGDMSWVAGSGTFYLQVDVNGVALVPRERLLSVPYALLAGGVTNGAITTMMIRDGAVMGYHLAGGSVGEAALAKDYRAGSIPVTLSGATETDLSLGQVFSPAFASTPIVTANLDAPGAPADFAPSVTVGARAPTGFSLRVRAPPVGEGAWRAPVLVDTNANTGVALSLAVLGGRPSIAYYEWDGADLFFARAADTNGAGWNKPEPAVTNGDVGFACTLLVVDGRPAISYYNRTGGALDLCYVRSSTPRRRPGARSGG